MNTDKDTIRTVEEVAELLKVTEATIRRSISAGQLRAFKRLGKWYVFQEDVVNFIKGGQRSDEGERGSDL